MTRQKDSKAYPSAQAPADPQEGTFDFDQWAGAVKRQMVASLKKRGSA